MDDMDNIDNVYEWKCTVCGEVIKSSEIPSICPVCGVGSDYFIKLEKSDAIFKSAEYKRFVVIGASAAGMAAIEEIRKRNRVCDILLISKEPVYGYYRPQLSKILAQNIDYDKIFIKDYNWFTSNKIEVMLDKQVIEINIKEKSIILNNGIIKEYDNLIIATGAECFMPPITGGDKTGVFTLRYLKDANDIREYAKSVKTATVVGGGVLGLETAWELKKCGLDVTVVELANRIFPRQLDEVSSKIFEKIILETGVKLVMDDSVTEIIGDDKTSGLKLKSGKEIETELVVVSAGIRANTKIAQDSGIQVNRAIIVDEKMKTNIDNIYACGDCCEFDKINYALWGEAIDQGKVAGINAVGDTSVYKSIVPSTSSNFFNTSIFSVGDVNPTEPFETKENDEENGTYQKLFYKNDTLVGAILIGDTRKSKDLLEKLGK
jgi:NAD(P)H-nitrite reductase large subunit